jgi:Fanconi-associated nuclease 1
MDAAIAELQTTRELPNDSDECENKLIAFESATGHKLQNPFSFAEASELVTTLDEAISLCKLDELKIFAKEVKVQGKNKSELAKNLRRSIKQQSGIRTVIRRSDTEASNKTTISQAENDEENIDSLEDSEQSESPGISDSNRDARFLKKIMDEIGQCIRLAMATLLLFERVHLVFYRSSEWTEKSLTTIILARIARRNFPEYIVSRSASIFESRDLLLEFEASLRMQYRVDSILEFSGSKPGDNEFKIIMDIYYSVLPRWREISASERSKEQQGLYQSGEGAYLRRLSPAWVYTRIIHKTSTILGKQKLHKEEHGIMTELLEQRLFHHSRRGAWYQRKALLEEHYMADINSSCGRADNMLKRKWKRVSLRTCEEGIEDTLVHIIYHHDLQKRIRKLEKACKIPMREQHDFSHVRLAVPVEVYVEGVRVLQKEEDEPPQKGSHRNSDETKKTTGARGTKTIWLDPLENNGECSVEAMCLSHYRSQGWKGFHCEGRLVRTLFAYLFFDIMFLYVPNVFQTPFQTCPLDLHTDAFYPTRMSEINQRLVEIENGNAPQLIQQIWDQHAENQTCVIGLDWAYEIDDLLEISRYFDGHALATICKVFCQEYGTRGGGLPDLFLWHTGKKEVKLSEVKSENDRLSDAQRLWIDVLTGAGVRVELCHAVDKKQ